LAYYEKYKKDEKELVPLHMPLEKTTHDYQVRYREFHVKIERYDLVNKDGDKISKRELFNDLWERDNKPAIEAIAQGSYPGIMFRLREGYINFYKQDQEKQRTVISLRARKVIRSIHTDSFNKEAVEKLLIEFAMQVHNDWDRIDQEVTRMYKKPK